MINAAPITVRRARRLLPCLAFLLLAQLVIPAAAQSSSSALGAPDGAASSRLSPTEDASSANMPSGDARVGQTEFRKIEMATGRSIIVNLPRDANEVFVSNQKVATAVIRGSRKISLVGTGAGETTVSVLDASGQQILNIDVLVGPDFEALRLAVQAVVPNARVLVRPVGASLLVTGLVNSAVEAQQVMDIATGFAGGGQGATNVINGLTIKGRDQVMLKVSISEVQTSIVKQLGIDATGTWSIGSNTVTAALASSFPAVGTAPNVGAIGLTTKTGNQITAKAMEQAGVSRVLAEPTLTAISGETANFLAGGEMPIPSTSTCNSDGSNCRIAVTFKPIGISLHFTPVVLSEGRISLRIATEVSEVDNSLSIKMYDATIPGTKTRRTDTTIELPSGGTLVTAGLIQKSSKQAMTGMPAVQALPILGALFRSRDYQRSDTELVIAVTPYIAKTIPAGQVVRPTDGLEDPMDPSGVFLGQVNRIYGKPGRKGVGDNGRGASYKGRVGFIND